MNEKIYDIFMEKLRAQKNIANLSRESGVPYTTIYNWIYGKTVPSIDNAQKVLNTLGFNFSITERK